ncbi:MAG: hypothetical protein JWM04_30 [Verrucomicrobiales bacterium]|nr:hypothetical protein [Verrucomicrobiales bacterium]
MAQDVGGESDRKTLGIPKVVCREFFDSLYTQQVGSDRCD